MRFLVLVIFLSFLMASSFAEDTQNKVGMQTLRLQGQTIHNVLNNIKWDDEDLGRLYRLLEMNKVAEKFSDIRYSSSYDNYYPLLESGFPWSIEFDQIDLMARRRLLEIFVVLIRNLEESGYKVTNTSLIENYHSVKDRFKLINGFDVEINRNLYRLDVIGSSIHFSKHFGNNRPALEFDLYPETNEETKISFVSYSFYVGRTLKKSSQLSFNPSLIQYTGEERNFRPENEKSLCPGEEVCQVFMEFSF